jgi:hypothetical protein
VDQSHWSRVFRWLFHPMRWSVAKRRIFLVFLPLTLPAWAAAVLVSVVLGVLECMVAQPALAFWNEPPRSRRGYYGYNGYHRPEHRRNGSSQSCARRVENGASVRQSPAASGRS